MARSSARQPPAAAALATADRLHSGAIRLLRAVRAADRATGLSGPRLSALSVVVFAGPLSMAELARAEQVRPPSMTRIIQALVRLGLVERVRDRKDGRVQRVRATAQGRRLLAEGRRRRVERIAAALGALPAAERRVLARASGLLAEVAALTAQDPARP
jgi:DNA-binding MarR family transcriptional regulator